MAKKKSTKPPTFTPWAKIERIEAELGSNDGDQWEVEYEVVQGKVNRQILDATHADEAAFEASVLTEIPEPQIQRVED